MVQWFKYTMVQWCNDTMIFNFQFKNRCPLFLNQKNGDLAVKKFNHRITQSSFHRAHSTKENRATPCQTPCDSVVKKIILNS